jgi:hypothetical protein
LAKGLRILYANISVNNVKKVVVYFAQVFTLGLGGNDRSVSGVLMRLNEWKID